VDVVKRLEGELIRDWRRLQNEQIPAVKTAALKAYYEKLASYRKSLAWSIELVPVR
jgi:hypothetical protein